MRLRYRRVPVSADALPRFEEELQVRGAHSSALILNRADHCHRPTLRVLVSSWSLWMVSYHFNALSFRKGIRKSLPSKVKCSLSPGSTERAPIDARGADSGMPILVRNRSRSPVR